MRESLRLTPSTAMRSAMPNEDTVIGGKYAVNKGDTIILSIYTIHHDTKVWGEDVRI